MTKEQRTKQLIRRTFAAGCVAGALIMYGISHIELPEQEPKQKCEWEQCDCIDSFGNTMYYNVHYHCAIHEHNDECTLNVYP